jgi:hypothetical protein
VDALLYYTQNPKYKALQHFERAVLSNYILNPQKGCDHHWSPRPAQHTKISNCEELNAAWERAAPEDVRVILLRASPHFRQS